MSVKLDSRGNRVNLLPVYINCNNWDADFSDMSNFFNQNLDTGLVILEDKNVRIGRGN